MLSRVSRTLDKAETLDKAANLDAAAEGKGDRVRSRAATGRGGLLRLGWAGCGGVGLGHLLAAALLATSLSATFAATVKQKPAAPGSATPVRIPLEPMGYQPPPAEFLLAGSSMLTVDFVDQDHLLVTFWVRRLMKREVDDPVDDADRTIGAFLVEASSGKVLARTEWRAHDRGRYLWNLGHGRFLLRVRDRLTVFAPMDASASDEVFPQIPLVKLDRHVVAILVSSDCDLLTIETTMWAMGSGETSEGFSVDPAPVEINFFRMIDKGPGADGLLLASAGAVRTQTAVALPITAVGRLDTLEGGKGRWMFNFDEHAGKVDELAEFDTSCIPRPTFVGRGEFVAFGCRGSDGKLDLAGFNMKGEEMWQQNFYDSQVAPTFSFAPAAGRFALGRTIVNGDVDPATELSAGMVTGQEVRVYQSHDGRQLIRVDCTPVERAGQNFALSPDGMRLAVVRATMVRHPATGDTAAYTQDEATVEIDPLPALSVADRAAVEEARKLVPADTGARIDLALAREVRSAARPEAAKQTGRPRAGAVVASAIEEIPQAADVGSGGTKAASGPSASGPSRSEQRIIPEGDAVPSSDVPRKPPTLYGPEDKTKKPQ